jgi:hypothetical protein
MARITHKKQTHKHLIGIPEKKKQLGVKMRRYDDRINTDLKEINMK